MISQFLKYNRHWKSQSIKTELQVNKHKVTGKSRKIGLAKVHKRTLEVNGNALIVISHRKRKSCTKKLKYLVPCLGLRKVREML